MSFNISKILIYLFCILFSGMCNKVIDQKSDQNIMYAIAKNGLVIRENPAAGSKKIGLVPYGNQVNAIQKDHRLVSISGKKGHWTRIEFSNGYGWVFGGLLSKTPLNDKALVSGFEIKAKFVRFELKVQPHFIFMDSYGKKWDFSVNNSTYVFERELPSYESNQINQGWGSNEKLSNKLFLIQYESRTQPLFLDGPVGKVLIIKKARLIDNIK